MEPLETSSDIKLTQYSHGAGCGCKIAPAVLHTMLSGMQAGPVHRTLLVGNDTKDDAAVVDLGDGTGIISTTDFFMPIVDDPHTFGRIAAANAISDIYAMGGTPLVAIAILAGPLTSSARKSRAKFWRAAAAFVRRRASRWPAGTASIVLSPSSAWR